MDLPTSLKYLVKKKSDFLPWPVAAWGDFPGICGRLGENRRNIHEDQEQSRQRQPEDSGVNNFAMASRRALIGWAASVPTVCTIPRTPASCSSEKNAVWVPFYTGLLKTQPPGRQSLELASKWHCKTIAPTTARELGKMPPLISPATLFISCDVGFVSVCLFVCKDEHAFLSSLSFSNVVVSFGCRCGQWKMIPTKTFFFFF